MKSPSWPRVLLRGEDSGNYLSVIETAVGPGVGPSLDAHDFGETFYVMEGELVFRVRDRHATVTAGQLAFAPRGVPHTFANLSGVLARQLIICTPAGFERYFPRMAAESQGTEPPEWARRPLPKVTTLGPRSALNPSRDDTPERPADRMGCHLRADGDERVAV